MKSLLPPVRDPVDQPERDRFIGEYKKNISVIAPAGVGKTDAIVKRIVGLAHRPDAVERLSRLVVVTYSVRAAQEMQRRAALGMRQATGISPQVHRAFQHTFFGTIHSYCVRLLERYGHYLGLPASVKLLQEDEEMWNRFLVHGLRRSFVHQPRLDELFHFYAPDKLYALGQVLSPGPVGEVGPIPEPNLQALIDYNDPEISAATRKALARVQAALAHWSKAWARGDRYHPLPTAPALKAPRFLELWSAAFFPLEEWLREAGLAFGRGVANAYEAFRLSEGVMTYDDQIRLALRALHHPAVQRELAQERLSVLLDEAQDTDFRQFEVLLRVAGLQEGAEQSEDQNYGIVGDFQQAIYAPRSDLAKYRAVHEQISAEPRGATSRFKVTFRCDRAIIDFVNRVFPAVLNEENEQSGFSELTAREGAEQGQVVRWACPDEPQHARGEKIKVELLARHEAQHLAEQIKKLGPTGLGARDWANVAILCPRKDWLMEISRELVLLKVPIQFHSSRERLQDRPAAAWLTALVWIAVHPEDAFEIAGVLRDVFGISDHDMALFTQGDGDRLRLDRPFENGAGPVLENLGLLREVCSGLDLLPLHLAAGRLIDRTHLRARLRAISELETENIDREINALLATAYERGAQGTTLAEWARELRTGLGESPTEEEEIRDAVQLMTSHKAKGLEWDAVIAPFFFRAIESKATSYPRLILHPSGVESIYRDKHDYAANAKADVDRRERQQLQRLLYVTCTRARRTLVLVDDEKLFSNRSRRAGWPAGELLGFNEKGVNLSAWKEIPESLLPPLKPTTPALPAVEVQMLAEDFSSARLREVVAKARDIPRRITPHALAIHQDEAEPEEKLERLESDRPDPHHPGILYGIWWHELIQTVPWQESRPVWQRVFEAALASSPQPDRAVREWDLFCASEFSRWLAEPGRIIQTEWPFLYRESVTRCIEGVIDLAVYVDSEMKWRVIDWKTNRPGPGGAAAIADIYRGQIQAYVKVMREMLGTTVEGSIYVTATGEWRSIE